MKLISLNTWGGKVFDPLMDFIKTHSKDTDIFCFQEIYDTKSKVKNYHDIRANLLYELTKVLPDFKFFYSIEFSGYDSYPDLADFDLTVGKAIFVKNNINTSAQDELLIHGDRYEKVLKKDFSNLPIILQCIDLNINGKPLTVCNFHGISYPGSKLDTKIRLEQSAKILDFLKIKRGSIILTGDFNLLPQTESIKIFEQSFRNLIKEFNIERTRSDLSPYAKGDDFQKFADYTFISKDIEVKNFEVPLLEISDHLPMILEFS